MYSIATYFRMLLPTLLPKEIRRILYLDCDVIILQDISELYKSGNFKQNIQLDDFSKVAKSLSVLPAAYFLSASAGASDFASEDFS